MGCHMSRVGGAVLIHLPGVLCWAARGRDKEEQQAWGRRGVSSLAAQRTTQARPPGPPAAPQPAHLPCSRSGPTRGTPRAIRSCRRRTRGPSRWAAGPAGKGVRAGRATGGAARGRWGGAMGTARAHALQGMRAHVVYADLQKRGGGVGIMVVVVGGGGEARWGARTVPSGLQAGGAGRVSREGAVGGLKQARRARASVPPPFLSPATCRPVSTEAASLGAHPSIHPAGRAEPNQQILPPSSASAAAWPAVQGPQPFRRANAHARAPGRTQTWRRTAPHGLPPAHLVVAQAGTAAAPSSSSLNKKRSTTQSPKTTPTTATTPSCRPAGRATPLESPSGVYARGRARSYTGTRAHTPRHAHGQPPHLVAPGTAAR